MNVKTRQPNVQVTRQCLPLVRRDAMTIGRTPPSSRPQDSGMCRVHTNHQFCGPIFLFCFEHSQGMVHEIVVALPLLTSTILSLALQHGCVGTRLHHAECHTTRDVGNIAQL